MNSSATGLLSRIDGSIQLARTRESVPDVKTRILYLDRLLAAVRKYSEPILAALEEELGRSRYDSYAFELLPLARTLKYLKRHLPDLASERRAGGTWFAFPAKFSVIPEPYGMVYIGSSWNYPFLLALEPVAGAIAAGNRVVLQLPLRVPRCVGLVKRIIEEVFTGDEVICFRDELKCGDIFARGCDRIFYTGSIKGAKDIMKNAAEFLIPAVLELGGKNPCIIDSDANLQIAAKRIVWGKFTNSGQTCVAPDYLVVHSKIRKEFFNVLSDEIRRKYGDFPLNSSGCGKVVDSGAYERLNTMSCSGRLIFGGEKEPSSRRISPTVLDQLEADDPLLTEEVFGPLLGVVYFEDTPELLRVLRRNPDPLAVYYFGSRNNVVESLKKMIRSGSLCINDCLMQFSNFRVPFGGIGKSGMGAYHGKLTFQVFSHDKTIMRQSSWFDLNLRYSGGKIKEKLIKYLFHH